MGIKYDWILPDYEEKEINYIKENYNLNDIASKILLARDIKSQEEIKQFLIGEYDEGFSPYLMYDMEKAVNRINSAIENEEKILIYGDYDADGITSTVLLLETLLSLGANVSSYIPNRFNEGYGPNKIAFENIINSGISLIITVDNGIAAVDEIEFANNLGCDVIITDHHQIQEKLPSAYAIIHPEHPKGNYPFGKLAGVGVAFKLAHALLEIYPDFLLDLVAIGTVADLVPLKSENRIFVKQGLSIINEDARLGIKLLLDIANHNGIIDEHTIGFVIAPRLNAIGRVASAKDGLLLLSSENITEAQLLAQKVDDYNSERKKITESIIKKIEKKYNSLEEQNIILIYDNDFHEGVLGIVASNLVEKYKKPVLIMNLEENRLKGSARSVSNFNIYEAINQIGNLFTAYGGHSMAAGFSTTLDNIELIENELSILYEKYLKENINYKDSKLIDLVLKQENVSYQLLSDLDRLKPYGTNFEKPNIIIEDAYIYDKVEFGSEKQYLRIVLGDEFSRLECISFRDNLEFKELKIGDTIDVLCNIDRNYFNGKMKIQGNIIDINKKEYIFKDSRGKISNLENLPVEELKLSTKFSDHRNNYYKFSELDLIVGKYDIINIVDIPNNLKTIYKLLELGPKSINIICCEKNPTYLSYLIDQPRLIKFFNILLKFEEIKLTNVNLNKLMTQLQTNINSLKIMINIFKELNLMYLEKNVLSINKYYKAINLDNSSTYSAMISKFECEKLLLTKSIKEINDYFKNY